MNEPLPPELKRTLAFWRWSSHCGVGSKVYFSFSCLSGGALKSHIPSSAIAHATKQVVHAMTNARSFCDVENAVSIAEHKMLACVRQLSSYSCSCYYSCSALLVVDIEHE